MEYIIKQFAEKYLLLEKVFLDSKIIQQDMKIMKIVENYTILSDYIALNNKYCVYIFILNSEDQFKVNLIKDYYKKCLKDAYLSIFIIDFTHKLHCQLSKNNIIQCSKSCNICSLIDKRCQYCDDFSHFRSE